jgi:hypothetical protein
VRSVPSAALPVRAVPRAGQLVRPKLRQGGGFEGELEVVEWQALDPHRTFEREPFLAWLAAVLAARECPGARIEVGPAGIHFFERPAAGAQAG